MAHCAFQQPRSTDPTYLDTSTASEDASAKKVGAEKPIFHLRKSRRLVTSQLRRVLPLRGALVCKYGRAQEDGRGSGWSTVLALNDDPKVSGLAAEVYTTLAQALFTASCLLGGSDGAQARFS